MIKVDPIDNLRHLTEPRPTKENTLCVLDCVISKVCQNGLHEYDILIDPENDHWETRGLLPHCRSLLSGVKDIFVGYKFKIRIWYPERNSQQIDFIEIPQEEYVIGHA